MAKILSPTRPYKVRGRVFWVCQKIPYELRLKADLFQQDLLDEFRFFGMLTRAQIKAQEPNFAELTEELSRQKFELYKHYPDEFLTKIDRGRIKEITRQINERAFEYNVLDRHTLESYCEKRAAIFILQKLNRLSYANAELIYYLQMKDALTIAQIRSLARSEHWQNLYSARNPFRHPLTDEEVALQSYTTLYKNIQQHPDCPYDILHDDDLVDGWLISQNKERSKKQVSYGAKIDSAKEIFVMAKDQDHANHIYDMNSDEARAIQNVRFKQMKRQGTVPFGKFADVQRERIMANNAGAR